MSVSFVELRRIGASFVLFCYLQRGPAISKTKSRAWNAQSDCGFTVRGEVFEYQIRTFHQTIRKLHI